MGRGKLLTSVISVTAALVCAASGLSTPVLAAPHAPGVDTVSPSELRTDQSSPVVITCSEPLPAGSTPANTTVQIGTRSYTPQYVSVSAVGVQITAGDFTSIGNRAVSVNRCPAGDGNLRIAPGQLATFEVVALNGPAVPTVPISQTVVYEALGVDVYGNPVPNSSVGAWVALSGGTLVDATALTATFRSGTLAGSFSAALSAVSNTISGTGGIIVPPGAPVSLVVAPPDVSMSPGGSISFVANGIDAYGNLVPNVPVIWSADTTAGVIGPTGRFTATTTVGSYPGAVKALSGTLGATANVTVVILAAASIDLTPASIFMPLRTTQLFTATVRDATNNVLTQASINWSSDAGVIESSGPLTAVLRAGTTPGAFGNGVVASAGSVSRAAAVTVRAPSLQLGLASAELWTDGRISAGFTVTVTDPDGNRVGPGVPVAMSALTTNGTVTVTPISGVTDAAGVFRGTLSSVNTSRLRTVTSTITLNALVPTAAASGVSIQLPGRFSPYRVQLPQLARITDPSGNHTGCTAWPMNVPGTAWQRANQAFNIYRFVAPTASVEVRLTDYPAGGRLLLYRLNTDRCASNGTVDLSLLSTPPLVPGLNQTRFTQLVPGAIYLLAVNTSAPLSDQVYLLQLER
jgi:large repetitive protein